MHCARSTWADVRRNCRRSSSSGYASCWLKGRRRKALARRFGPSSECAISSSGSSHSGTVRCMSGAFWADWGSRARGRSGARSNVTKMSCVASSDTRCRGLKKSPARTPGNSLHRRVRIVRTPHAGEDLGSRGSNPRYPVSLQLETVVGYCGHVADSMHVSFSRRGHPKCTNRGLPQSVASPFEAETADYLGWLASTSLPPGSRLRRFHQRPNPAGVPAALRAGHQPGGIFVGLAQASCVSQLLSGQPDRASHRCTRQAQKCTAATLHHRRMLETSKAVLV